MLGELNEIQINNLLASQAVGRIACTDGKKPYIVPVTYAYDGRFIYGQTKEGMKVDILRKFPDVCFEVDVMTDMFNWQSVVVWGEFEELQGEQAADKREYLSNRLLPIMATRSVHAHQHDVTSVIDDSNRIKPILYRIKIIGKSGRFEKM